jgi:uncharacterized protein (TIGR02145 family)
MAENLAFMPQVNSPEGYYSAIEQNEDTVVAHYFVYGFTEENLTGAKATTYFGTYGALYSRGAAESACPSGWHLPSDTEWKEMERFLGMGETDMEVNGEEFRISGSVGKKLKSDSGWHNEGNGDNSSLFNALPAGILLTDFNQLGNITCFWFSNSSADLDLGLRGLSFNSDGNMRYIDDKDLSFSFKHLGLSIRCIKDK